MLQDGGRTRQEPGVDATQKYQTLMLHYQIGWWMIVSSSS